MDLPQELVQHICTLGTSSITSRMINSYMRRYTPIKLRLTESVPIGASSHVVEMELIKVDAIELNCFADTLTRLILCNCAPVSCETLASMSNLQTLVLLDEDTKCSMYTASLSSLTSLTSLSIWIDEISKNLSLICGLTHLKELSTHVMINSFDELGMLSALTNLTRLEVEIVIPDDELLLPAYSEDSLRWISHLKSMKELRLFTLGPNGFYDIDDEPISLAPLMELKDLTLIDFCGLEEIVNDGEPAFDAWMKSTPSRRRHDSETCPRLDMLQSVEM